MDTNILVVDNYDSFTWNLIHLIEQLDVPYSVCQNDQIPWDLLDGFSHFLLSPGTGLPKESADLMKLIGLIEGKRSILGVCLGFQALAEFYGSGLMNLAQVRHGVQRELTQFKGPLFENIASMHVGLYHSWGLDPNRLSEEIVPTSYCSDGWIMSFHHKSSPSFGVQFHPESIMSTHGLALIQNWLKVTESFSVLKLNVG